MSLSYYTDRGLASVDVVQVTGLDEATDTSTEHSLDYGAYRAPSSIRYAAAGTLAAEAALRRAAVDHGEHALDPTTTKAWLDEHAPTLGADQRAVIEGLATSPARLAVLVGPAGSGKSYTTGVLADLWTKTSDGGRVIGLATSKIATEVLRDDGITDSVNISAFLAAQDRLDHTDQRHASRPDAFGDERWRLGPRDVVLIDEASMVATAHLDAIRTRVEAAGGRIVLAGDPRQLAAVEAGGALGLLDGHAETYTLTDIRRFTEPWERDASLQLRAGDPDALVDYDRHGRLLDADTVDDAITAAVRGAVADRLTGQTSVVVATTDDLAARISARVRDQLIALGHVQETGGTTLGRDGNTGSIGDQIMCRRNHHTLGVTNRGRYTITDITQDGDLVVQALDRSGQAPATRSGSDSDPGPDGDSANDSTVADRITLPVGYVAEHVQLAYAATVHATQGITVDRGYFVTDGAAGPATQYVALTRGRDRNTAVVALNTPGHEPGTAPAAVTRTGGVVELDGPTARPTARAVLETGLDRDDPTNLAATVTAEHDRERAASMTTILGQIETQTRHACRHRMERHLDDLTTTGVLSEADRGRLAADQGSEYLSRLLRVAEQAGHNPRDVLAEAITGGKNLDDADSIAQILSYRLTRSHDLDRPAHRREAGHEPATAEAHEDGPAQAERSEADKQEANRRDQAARQAGVALPGDITPDEHARLTALRVRADDRARDLGARTAQEAPDWAVLSLGAVPSADDAADRADWEHRAGQVAAHREAVGWDHPDQPLGRMPGTTTTERRTTYTAAWQALGQPSEQLSEAAMTEGRLRTRVRAWQNEQTWAPPNVDDALKAAELDREAVRQDAARAEVEQRADEASHHRELAAALDDRVQRLTDAAQARADWYRHTVITHAHAEAATAELQRRGINPGSESDRTTAAEWLAADREARQADDVHRAITENNVLDHELIEQAQRVAHPSDGTSEATHWADAGLGPAAQSAEDGHVSQEATRNGAARSRIDPSASAGEVEALAAGTTVALRVAADRNSQHATQHEAEHEDLPSRAAEAGRQRREAADIDVASSSLCSEVDLADLHWT